MSLIYLDCLQGNANVRIKFQLHLKSSARVKEVHKRGITS